MQSQVDGENSGKHSSSNKTTITEVSSKVRVPIVDGAPPPLSTAGGWSRMPFVDPPSAPAAAAVTASNSGAAAKSANFTKVAISFDDSDSEESEEEKEETKGEAPKSMFRVPIEDDNDDDEEEDGVLVPPANSHKVVIQDETSSEEEMEQEGNGGKKTTEKEKEGGSTASAKASGGGEVSEWDLEQQKRKGVQLFSATRYDEAQAIFAKALADVETVSRQEGKVRVYACVRA